MSINFPSAGAVYAWQPAAVLKIEGSDAGDFLQGQFTNDVRKAGPEVAVYGLWLTLKGKIVGDSFLLQKPAGVYWVISYATPAALLRERLEHFIIADDVNVTDETAAWAGLTVFREFSSAALATFAAAGALVFTGRRTKLPHHDCVVPVDRLPALRSTLGNAEELSDAEVEWQRIAAAIPAIPRDLGPNDLPNEGHLDEEAVSYTKGCYLGQEVMARLKSMGQVRRKLLPVSGQATDCPPLPAAVYVNERQVGELRSAACHEGTLRGLAMLNLLPLGAATALAFSADGPPMLQLHQP